jgi:O-antigen biosynthesis protein
MSVSSHQTLFVHRQSKLVEAKRSLLRPWGWKDPRSVLLLNFWAELVPDARYLFVFRPPWDVVDSLYRRGDRVFSLNPRFALTMWMHYNARIRDFARGQPRPRARAGTLRR